MQLKTLRIFAFLTLLLTLSATAEAKVIKIATIAPEGSSWMRAMNEGADEIAKKTEGRVKFKFFTGGVMGNDRGVLRKVRAGQLDGGMLTLGALAEASPDLKLYSMPFLFPSLEAVDRVRKELDPVLAEGLYKGGFTSFGFAEGGFARFFAKRPIDSVDSMKGRKIWVPEGDSLSVAGMQSLGLTPVTVPITDVLTGLQTGLLEVVANSSIGALALQWHTATTHVTTTPLAYVAATMAVKNSTIDELAPADRAVVKEVMERVYRQFDRQNREDEGKAYKALLAEGIKPVTPKEAEVEGWRSVAASLSEKMAQKGDISADLYRRAYSLARGR